MRVTVGVDVIVGVAVWVGVNDEVGVMVDSGVDSFLIDGMGDTVTELLVAVINVLVVDLEDQAWKKSPFEKGWLVYVINPVRMIMLNSIVYPGMDLGRNPKVKNMADPRMAAAKKKKNRVRLPSKAVEKFPFPRLKPMLPAVEKKTYATAAEGRTGFCSLFTSDNVVRNTPRIRINRTSQDA